MASVNRAGTFSQIQNLNKNFKYELVTTQVTMCKTNTFLWMLHRRMHTKQSQTDFLKYVQWSVAIFMMLNRIRPETEDQVAWTAHLHKV